MKKKNYFAVLFPIWAIACILQTTCCLVSFVDGDIIKGTIYLILAVAFGFVSGILLVKAIIVYKHNLACDYFMDIVEGFIENEEEGQTQNLPFEEFNTNKGE